MDRRTFLIRSTSTAVALATPLGAASAQPHQISLMHFIKSQTPNILAKPEYGLYLKSLAEWAQQHCKQGWLTPIYTVGRGFGLKADNPDRGLLFDDYNRWCEGPHSFLIETFHVRTSPDKRRIKDEYIDLDATEPMGEIAKKTDVPEIVFNAPFEAADGQQYEKMTLSKLRYPMTISKENMIEVVST